MVFGNLRRSVCQKQARETVTQVRFWIARHRLRRLVDVMMVK
jgi:hypothetical protein